MRPKTIALFLLIAFLVIVLVQNMSPTAFKILLWQIEMPLLILTVSAIFLGMVIGWFGHISFRKGREIRQFKKAAAKIDQPLPDKNDPSKNQLDNM